MKSAGKCISVLSSALLVAGIFLFLTRDAQSTVTHRTGWTRNLGAWRFHLGDIDGASGPGFDDSSWEQVFIPHTLKIEPRLYKGGRKYFRGQGWYRTVFDLSAAERAGSLRLEFDGAMIRADVWLNGEYLGDHLGGYTPFAFDITEKADWSGENILAVKVDNRTMEVPPDGAEAATDYNLYGGLNRAVRLVARAEVFVDDVFITTPSVSLDSAKVCAKAWIRNTSSSYSKSGLSVELFGTDKSGAALKLKSEETGTDPGGVSEVDLSGTVKSPLLWSPDSPHLYTAVVSVLSTKGRVIDSISTRIGIRWFEFTPDRGFFLNGEPQKLIGFNRHQSYPYLGNAVPDRYQRFDARLIKDTGANFVRLSHYPQAPSFLDACDELGLIAYEELPGWHYIGGDGWKDLAEQALREMILRDRNRPSVMLWGVRINEAPDDPPFTDRLNAAAHELDPTRPTTGARVVGSYDNFFEDVISLNDYTVSGIELPVEKPHVLSETVGVNYQSRRGGKPERVRNFVEWHIYMLNRVYADPTCSGEAVWGLADYNSFLSPLLGVFDHLWHWCVTDAWRIPKASYYAYTSQLSKEPFVYIVGPWDRKSLKDVMVLHNCEMVELSVNGRSLGRKGPDRVLQPNPWIIAESYGMSMAYGKYGVKPVAKEIPYSLPHPPTTFHGVKYEPGEISAKCIVGGEVAVEHTRQTLGGPYRFVIEPDFTEIYADGSDMTRVVVTLVDDKNIIIEDSNAKFEITSSGPARILSDREPRLEAGQAAFFVQSASLKTGEVSVKVGSEAMEIESDALTISLMDAR